MRRLALVLALIVAGCVASIAPVPAATSTYVVTTQNVRHTLGPVRARHDLAQAQRGSDLVLTQEMGRRRASRYASAGFSTIQASDADGLAIYVRRTVFDVLGAFPLLLHRSTLFGSATRYALVTVLRTDATRRCLIAVDVHMIPHIERRGRPLDSPRQALVRRAISRLSAFVRARRCALVVGGDWNIDGHADARVRTSYFPYASLTPLGLRSEWRTYPYARGTLGARKVDGFYFDGIRTLSRRTIFGTYSDHNGSRLRFELQ